MELDDESGIDLPWNLVLPMERGFSALVEQRAAVSEDQPGTTLFVASTDTPDRAMDVVRQDWRTREFLDNPVILDNHNPMRVVGYGLSATVPKVGDDAGKLMIRVAWDTESPDPSIKNVGHQHMTGIRRAGSVGFRARKSTPRNKLDKDHPAYQEPIKVETWWGGTVEVAGTYYEGNTLLEFSSATIPMNPEALQRAMTGPGLLLADAKQRTGDVDLLEALKDPATAAAVIRCLAPAFADHMRRSDEIRRIVQAYLDARPATTQPVDLLTRVAQLLES